MFVWGYSALQLTVGQEHSCRWSQAQPLHADAMLGLIMAVKVLMGHVRVPDTLTLTL